MPYWEINDEAKIRLNLSSLALSVIEQDQMTFRAKSRTHFLNQIFLRAYTGSDASIAAHLGHLHDHYQQLFQDLQLSDKSREDVIDRLLQEEKSTLIHRHTNYSCARSPFAHKLTQSAVNALMDASEESTYYSPPQYFKAVVEDYCRQSAAKRERIYFSDFFTTMQSAIDRQQQLDITCHDGSRYKVHPYQLLTDQQSSYHYLVCYARTKDQTIKEKTPYSFRINQLTSVRCTEAHSFLSQDDRDKLDDAVLHKGVPFFMQPSMSIKVQLTPRGVRQLKRHATLRPQQSAPPEGDVYTFQCTSIQAEYYFTKLGADAKILEPASLRTRFARLYSRAAAVYADLTNDQQGNGISPNSTENGPKQE